MVGRPATAWRRGPVPALVLLLLLSACAGDDRVETPQPPPLPDASQPATAPDCLARVIAADTLHFRSGEGLDQLLSRGGVGGAERRELIGALAEVFSPAGFRSGQALRLVRADGTLLGITSPLDYVRDLCVWRRDEGFAAAAFTAELTWQPRAVAVTLESSFYEGLLAAGESGDLATRVADLFAGEVDFYYDLRTGDRMELLLESADRPDREGERDRVLAARLVLGGEPFEAFLHPDADGRRRYFHRDGGSLERQFLKAPVLSARVSSGFSRKRLHPILGVERPHHGVDYAAPTGTSILATADGTVLERRRDGSAGRFVKLRHPGGIETSYLHLSRWASGVSAGKRVRKGQVIGYVGSTGLSTGPHVCYRLRMGGNYVDPRRFQSRPAAPLTPEEMPGFTARVTGYDSLWSAMADGTGPPALVDDETPGLPGGRDARAQASIIAQ